MSSRHRLIFLLASASAIYFGAFNMAALAQTPADLPPREPLVPPLVAVSPVTAIQGYATDGTRHFLFSTSSITAYDANWNVLWTNSDPFKGLPAGVTHIGDGDYSRGKLYAPVEDYRSCDNNTKQTIAVYNAKNGKFEKFFDISSFGHEVSSVTVVQSSKSMYVSSFCDDSTVYQYDLKSIKPAAPLHLSRPIGSIQGISWSEARHQFAITSDSPDEKVGYVWGVTPAGIVTLLYTAPQAGEMEGVDYTQGQIRYLLRYVWFLSPTIGATPAP